MIFGALTVENLVSSIPTIWSRAPPMLCLLLQYSELPYSGIQTVKFAYDDLAYYYTACYATAG